MSPNEIAILGIAVEEQGEVNKWVISRRMIISSHYADYLLQSLASKGFLLSARSGKYRLTPKGGEMLLATLHQAKGKLTANVMRYRQLVDDINETMDRLKDLM